MNSSINALKKLKQDGERFSCLTCYDASFAQLLHDVGVDLLLVGDSLGMVIQGQESTLPVTMDDMVYHSRLVRRGAPAALLMVDMPFLSYANTQQAIHNAGRLLQEGGANIVKLEGGGPVIEIVAQLTQQNIPVCAHLGLQPQSVYKLGGYKVQGRDENSARKILDDAFALQEAGADLMLLECVPANLATQVTKSLQIPVIGIGAGPNCDAQVLVLYDMLGLKSGPLPRFAKDFMVENNDIRAAIQAYVNAVKRGEFPNNEQSYNL